MHANRVTVTVYQGPAGDHNTRAADGARLVGDGLAARLGIAATIVGIPAPLLDADWVRQLEAARPSLAEMAETLNEAFARGARPVSALTRCAVGLATLPVVMRHRPRACVVWLDAHADLNTPDTSPSGYLGGMALAGAAGLWDSGLGSGLAPRDIVLVGVRDADPPEQALMHTSGLRVVPADAAAAPNLRQAVAGRPVYVHLDCDVLEPGLVPTDYAVAGGFTFDQIHQACVVLAEGEVVGLEIAEFQDAWDDGVVVSATPLMAALDPLLRRLSDR
jgi:arginase